MSFSPIVLFVYNRLDHTKKTIDALALNNHANESELFIFSDAAKDESQIEKVKQIRNYIEGVSANKKFKNVTIIKREKNMGLANSIISGVTEVINEFGKVIVLEDDIVTCPFFLEFMNKALDFYENDDNIGAVSGYNYPFKMPRKYKKDIYLHPLTSSWGWATWGKYWKGVDWEVKDYDDFSRDKTKVELFNRWDQCMSSFLEAQVKNDVDSWAIRWDYSLFKRGLNTLFPVKSFIQNIGHDNSGVHCVKSSMYELKELSTSANIKFEKNISIDENVLSKFKIFTERTHDILFWVGIYSKKFKVYKFLKPIKDKLMRM